MKACVFDECLPPYTSDTDPMISDLSVDREMLKERHLYLYHLRRSAFMEPEFGYVIAEPWSLINLSLPGSELVRQRETMPLFSGVPSVSKLFAAKKRGSPVRKESVVVSFRFVFDYNYYHFYCDIMNRLKIIDDYGIDKSVPLIVSPVLASQKFFQRMSERGDLANRNWLVQDGFHIQAEEIIFLKPDPCSRAQIDYFLECGDIPTADISKNRRIFLNRGVKDGRNIANIAELTPVLRSYDFEVIDAANMTFDEQRELFSQTGFLIAIHGAGLVNFVFRRSGPLKVLEIFPPSETPLMFYELSRIYGFDYQCVRGKDAVTGQRRSPFYLDPALLKEQLVVMFQ